MNRPTPLGLFRLCAALAVVALFCLSGCSVSILAVSPLDQKTLPGGTIHLNNYQAASVAIGQADFVTNTGYLIPTSSRLSNNDSRLTPTLNQGHLLLSDSGFGRILGFNSIPTTNGSPADFLIGQADFSKSIQATGAHFFYGPTSALNYGNKFLVTDAKNNRILIWNNYPTIQADADAVIGQSDFVTNGQGCDSNQLANPDSSTFVTPNGKLLIADSDNARVLIYNTIPSSNSPQPTPDLVLGQTDFITCTQRMTIDGTVIQKPKGIWSDGKTLIIGDSQLQRVLIWKTFPTLKNQSADLVLGAPALDAVGGLAGGCLSTPATDKDLCYGQWNIQGGITSNGTQLFISDSGNNRVLIWNQIPNQSYASADIVLGQSDFSTYESNSGGSPTAKTLNYPGGLALFENKLIVGDRNNNRYLVFTDTNDSSSHSPLNSQTPTVTPYAPSLTLPTFDIAGSVSTSYGIETIAPAWATNMVGGSTADSILSGPLAGDSLSVYADVISDPSGVVDYISLDSGTGDFTFKTRMGKVGVAQIGVILRHDNTGVASELKTFNITSTPLSLTPMSALTLAGTTGFPSQLLVKVTDSKSAVVPNVAITWALKSGSGTLDCTSSTDSTGNSQCGFTPSSSGPSEITATIDQTNLSRTFTINSQPISNPVHGSQLFTYTGADQTFTLPVGPTSLNVVAELWGGGGSGGGLTGYYIQTGGGGVYVKQLLTLNQGDIISLKVGQGGQLGSTALTAWPNGQAGWSITGAGVYHLGGGGASSSLWVNGSVMAEAGGGAGAGAWSSSVGGINLASATCFPQGIQMGAPSTGFSFGAGGGGYCGGGEGLSGISLGETVLGGSLFTPGYNIGACQAVSCGKAGEDFNEAGHDGIIRLTW